MKTRNDNQESRAFAIQWTTNGRGNQNGTLDHGESPYNEYEIVLKGQDEASAMSSIRWDAAKTNGSEAFHETVFRLEKYMANADGPAQNNHERLITHENLCIPLFLAFILNGIGG